MFYILLKIIDFTCDADFIGNILFQKTVFLNISRILKDIQN